MRRAAARHDHHAVPKFRSSRPCSSSGSDSATVPARKPPAALTSQRGSRPSPARRSQNASTASASVRSTTLRSAGTTWSPRASRVSTSAEPSAPPAPHTRATSATDELEKLASELEVFFERSAPEGGDGPRVLLDAPHLGAEMRGLEMHGDAARLDQLDERVGDLRAKTFLNGEAAREQPHEPCELRDADDLVA